MVAQLQDTFLRPERLQAMRRALALMYETLSTLSDLKHRASLHPYDLFVILRRLLLELCTFHEVVPDQPALPYRHEELAKSYFGLLHELVAAPASGLHTIDAPALPKAMVCFP